MSDNPLSGKVGLDTTDFKSGITQMNREIRLIEAGFRASAAGLENWAETASGLEMRIKALNEQLTVQKSKVGALQGEWERVAKEKGTASRAAQDLQLRLLKETETLNKMQGELNQTQKSLDGMGNESADTAGQVDNLAKKEDEAERKAISLKGALGGLGKGLKTLGTIAAGAAAGVAAIGAGITKAFLSTADAAGELVDLSLKTGFTTTQLQEIDYVGKQLGTDTDTMVSSLARMTRSMGAAKEGTGAQAEAFAALGISVTDANGNLRDSRTVFAEAIDALGKMPNETERDAAAMELFGRSAMELNPLIKAGSSEIERLTGQAHQVGAVMSEESVAGMESFGDTLESLKSGLKGTVGTLMTSFLPGFQGLAGKAQGYLGEFAKIVGGAGGDLGKMAGGLGGLLGTIVGDAARAAPQMLQAGLGILQGIFGALIAQLPTILPAITQMLSALVGFIVQAAPMLMNAGVQIILALINGLLPQLPMLLEAAIQMIVALANGLAAALPQLMAMVATIIPQLIITLIQNLPLLINAALQLILALVNGLVIALPILIQYIPEIVTAIFNALVLALPLIADAAVQLVMTLIDGIGNLLPKIGEAAGRLIQTLVEGIKKLLPVILDVGVKIVEGIWNGILSRAKWFGEQVWNFFKNIVDGVKKALGIESPSKVFAGIGENMALGLGRGFSSSLEQVRRDVNRAVNDLAGAQVNLAGGGAGGARRGGGGAGDGSTKIEITGNVRNAMDIELITQKVVERLAAA